MHSPLDSHLLKHLGALYGSGKLLNGRVENSEAAASSIDGQCGADRPIPASLARLVRIPVTDTPITDVVLDDPQDDPAVGMMVRGRAVDSGDDT